MTEQDAADRDAPAADESTDSASGEQREGTPEEEAQLDDAGEELIERVAESDPETIASEMAALRTRIDGLGGKLTEREGEIEELESKLKRKQADFQNYKKRMNERREQEQQRATEDLVTNLLDVRDNLQRALEQDEDVDIRDGVESTLRQFDDVLEAENVDVIEPESGSEVDPQYHQVLARVDSEQPEGTIDDVHRLGYVMAEKVLRAAQVTVSDGN